MKKGPRSKKLDSDGIISHIDDEQEDIVFDDSEDGAHLVDKIKKLQKQLKECKIENREYLDGWQRAKADIINSKKEEEKRRTDFVTLIREGLLFELLPTLDSFDMAFGNKEVWEKVDKNWRVGVEHIHTQLLGILKQYNLEPFDPIGTIFNPSEHDSIESVSTDKKSEDNIILTVLQKGYKINKKVVRPAKVTVATFKK